MSFVDAVAAGYRRFGAVHGRARRSEYWWFLLYAALVAVGCQLLILALWSRAFEGALVGPGQEALTNPDTVGWGWFTAALAVMFAYAVGVAIPAWTAGSRRLHDAGMSGAWMLLVLVGLGVVPLIMCAVPGQVGSNRHGPDPKAALAAVAP